MKNRHENQVELEQMLHALKQLEIPKPPSSVRNRLRELHAERAQAAGFHNSPQQILTSWSRPVIALGILAAAVIAVIFFTAQRQHNRIKIQASAPRPITVPAALPANHAVAETGSHEHRPVHQVHTRSTQIPRNSVRRIVVQLPYSNSAIVNGTSTTVLVPMSEYELASLGFPMNGNMRDARVLAELTLGDDGLPRAISVPLPFEVIKERR